MLDKYLKSVLNEEQRQKVLEVLQEIKSNEALLEDFLQSDLKQDPAQTIDIDTVNLDDNLLTETELLEPTVVIQAEKQTNDTFIIDDASPTLDITVDQTLQASQTLETAASTSGTFFNEQISLNQEQEAEEFTPSQKPENKQPTLGRYLDLGLLGKGGMGEVRKIRDQVLNRNLAMKIVHPNILRNKNALSRFIEEAQVGAQLQHPNIVPIHELGQLEDGRYYFTMKEIKGIEFTELIRGVHQASTDDAWKQASDGTSFRRLIQVFHTMCETIAFAHSLGVIHRDLKPENVMIGGFGEVLIVDWGIAKVLGREEILLEEYVETEQDRRKTRMGMVAGTPVYMSPEQAMGRVDLINIQSDIYTLGAILYEILAGHPPFTGRDVYDVLEKVKHSTPPSLLTTINSFSPDETLDLENIEEIDSGKLPLPLIHICQKAMEREITKRYQSAIELAKDVLDWLEGAQKRDKALKEYEAATQLLHLAQEHEHRYQKLWLQANNTISKNNANQSKSWQIWEEATHQHKQAQALRRQYQETLKGALVYAPDLEEANEALSELLINDIVKAVANGERKQREVLETQFEGYLKNITKRKQAELRKKLEESRQDEILLLRCRRGALVGRQSLRDEITEVLRRKSRLISLVGTAGVGKTRLALEIIHDLKENDAQTYFCNLTEANSELSIAFFVAKSLNIKLRERDPIGQLGEIFAERKTILVLDNLEQIVGPIGSVIQQWLRQSTSLRIIATSRVKLRILEEHSFSVLPLSTLEAMELFTKRGQQANPQFMLDASSRSTVSHLVLQLDSLPLAIELAAARLNIFSVEEVAERLKERFSLLRSRSKDTQALQGALDWSWDLLKPWAKAALTQASVFKGGFTLQAADSILQCGDWQDAPAIFDILQDLCEDSLLLQSKSEEGDIRYGMLESIRQYSQVKIKQVDAIENGLSGKDIALQTEYRHAKYFAQFGDKKFLASLDSIESANKWSQLFEELDNLVAGTEYGEGEAASLCCLGVMKILGMKGPMSLGLDVVEAVLSKTDIPKRRRKQLEIQRTRFLRISGRMKEARGRISSEKSASKPTETSSPKPKEKPKAEDLKTRTSLLLTTLLGDTLVDEPEDKPSEEEIENLKTQAEEFLEKGRLEETEAQFDLAIHFFEKAQQIYSEIKNLNGVAEAMHSIAGTLRRKGEAPASVEMLKEALRFSKDQGLLLQQAKLSATLGNALGQMGQLEEALQHHQTSLQINQQLENKSAQGSDFGNIALIYYFSGDYPKALDFCLKAVQISKEIGEKKVEGSNLSNAALIYTQMGNFDEALEYYQKGLQINRQIHDRQGEAITLNNIAQIYFELGEHQQALIFYTQALKISREIGDRRNEADCIANIGAVHQKLNDNEKAMTFFQEALILSLELGHKSLEGIILGNIGVLHHSSGQIEKAIPYLEKSIEISLTTQPPIAAIFGGSLALAQAQQGLFSEAQQTITRHEKYIAVIPVEHCQFLCKKAKIHHLQAQQEKASESLSAAKMIAKGLESSSGSELEQAILEAENFLKIAPHSKKNADELTLQYSTEEMEELRLQAEEFLEKGRLDRAESQFDDAESFFDKAYEIFHRIQNVQGLVTALSEKAKLQLSRGNLDISETISKKALSLLKTKDFPLLKADILSLMGRNYSLQHQFSEALPVVLQAIQLYQKLGNEFEQGKNLNNLAFIYLRQNNLEEALSLCTKALHLNRKIGSKAAEGLSLLYLSRIYKNLQEYQKSLENLSESINIFEEIGNQQNASMAHIDMAILYTLLGEEEKALEIYETQLQLFRDIGAKFEITFYLGNTAQLLFSLGNTEKAIQYEHQAIQLAQEQSLQFSEGVDTGELGHFYYRIGKINKAEVYLRRAIELLDELSPFWAGDFRVSLALLQIEQGNQKEALGLLQKGEEQFFSNASQSSITREGKFYCRKAKILHFLDQTEEANTLLQKAADIVDSIPQKPTGTLAKLVVETRDFLSKSPQLFSPSSELLTLEEIEELELQAEEFLEKGRLEEAQSEFSKALHFYNQALLIYQSLKQTKGIIQTQIEIANILRHKGDAQQSNQILQQAQIKAEENSFIFLQTKILLGLGKGFEQLGELERSLQYYTQVLAFNQQIGDSAQESISLSHIAFIHKELGNHHSSLEFYQKALLLNQQIGNKRVEGEIQGNIASVYVNKGEYEKALSYFEQAIQINKEIGNTQAETKNIANIAMTYRYLGNYKEALNAYQTVLRIFQELGDKKHEGVILGNIANGFWHLGDYDKALSYYKKALNINEELNNKPTKANNLGNIANLYKNLGDYEKALSCYQEALDIFREIGSKRPEGSQLTNIALVYDCLGRHQESLEYHQKAIALHQELGNKRDEGISLGNLGDLLYKLGRVDEAIEYFELSIPLCDETIPPAAGVFRGSLALAYAGQQRFPEALELLKQGEPQIQKMPAEYGRFLCKKAKTYQLGNQKISSKEALSQAEQIAKKINASPKSELAVFIEETRRFLSTPLSHPAEKDTILDTEDLELQAEELLEKGNIEEAETNYSEALDFYHQAMQLYQMINNQTGIINGLNGIANILEIQGKTEQAIERYQQALQLAQDIQQPYLEAKTLNGLGNVFRDIEDFENALLCLQKALAIDQKIGNKRETALNLLNIGVVYAHLEKNNEALEYFHQAKNSFREIGDRRHENNALLSISNILFEKGKYMGALQYSVNALENYQEIGDKLNEGICLGNLSVIHSSLGKFEQAEKLSRRSIKIHREIGVPRSEAFSLEHLALSLRHQGRLEESFETYQKAREIHQRFGNKSAEAVIIGQLGILYHKQNQLNPAIEHLNIAISACEASHKMFIGIFQLELALIRAKQGQFTQALSLLHKSESFLQNSIEDYGDYFCYKAKIHQLGKQATEAKKALQQATDIANTLELTKTSRLHLFIQETAVFLASPSSSSILSTKTEASLTEQELEDLNLQAEELHEKAQLELAESQFQKASDLFTQALQIHQRIGSKKGIASNLLSLAVIKRNQGDFEEAIDIGEKAFALSKEENLIQLQADILLVTAYCYHRLVQSEKALQYLQKALIIYQTLGDDLNEAKVLTDQAAMLQAAGNYEQALENYKQARIIFQTIGAKLSEATNLGNTGSLYEELGEYEKALEHYQQALILQKELGNKSSEGMNLARIGGIYHYRKQYEEALEYYQQSLLINQAIGNKHSEGACLGNIGSVYYELGKTNKAIEYIEKAIRLSDQTNPLAAGISRGTLAVILAKQGKYDAVPDLLTEAEAQVQNNRFWYAMFLCNKAKALHATKQEIEAKEALSLAQAIAKALKQDSTSELGELITETEAFFKQNTIDSITPTLIEISESQLTKDEIEDLRLEAEELFEKGLFEETEGNYEESLSLLKNAMEIYQHLKDINGITHTLISLSQIKRNQGNAQQAINILLQTSEFMETLPLSLKSQIFALMGVSYGDLGDYDKSINYLEQNLKINQETGNTLQEGICLGNIATIYHIQGDYEKALSCYQKTISISQEIGNKRTEGRHLGNMAIAYAELGFPKKALEYHQKALQIQRDIGDKRGEGITLGYIALTYSDTKQYTKAFEYYQQALSIHQDLQNDTYIGITLGNIGDLFYQQQDLEKGANYLEEAIDTLDHKLHPAAGAFRSILALIRMEQGKQETALLLLKGGEEKIQHEKLEYGKFLCNKARILHQAGQKDKAKQALSRAKTIGKKQNINPKSRFAILINKTEAFLSIDHLKKQLTKDEIEDLRLEAEELLEKGKIEQTESNYEQAEALFNQALRLYEQINDPKGIVESLIEIAAVQHFYRKLEQAISTLSKALQISKRERYLYLQAKILEELGVNYSNNGLRKPKKALEYYQDALKIYQQTKNKIQEASCISGIANIYSHIAQPQEAIIFYKRAIKLHQETGNRRGECVSIANLALSYENLGQYKEALNRYQNVTEIFAEIGEKNGIAHAIKGKASCYHCQGKYQKAIPLLEQAIQIYHEIGEQLSLPQTLRKIALIHHDLGDYDEAINYYNQAIEIVQKTNNPYEQAFYLGNRALVYGSLKEYQKAEQDLELSIETAIKTENRAFEAMSHGNLGKIFYEQGKIKESIPHFERCIAIQDELLPKSAGYFRGHLALSLAEEGRRTDALLALKKGEDLLGSIPNMIYPTRHGEFHCKKAKTLHLFEQKTEALQALNQAKNIAKFIQLQENAPLSKMILDASIFLTQPPKSRENRSQLTEDEQEDLRLEAEEFLEKGKLEEAESQFEQAIQLYERAKDIYEQLQDAKGITQCLIELSSVQRNQGRTTQSIQTLEQAEKIALTHDLKMEKAEIYSGLGLGWQYFGEYEKALDYQNRSLKFNREIGSKIKTGIDYNNIASIYEYSGQFEKALLFHQKSLEIHEETGNKRNQGASLGNIGTVYSYIGDYDNALQFLHQALVVDREIGCIQNETTTLSNLALIYKELGEYDKAIVHSHEALANFSQIGDQRTLGVVSGNLGDLYYLVGKLAEAERYLRDAISLCKKELPPAAAAFQGSLALLKAEQGDIPTALELIQKGEEPVSTVPLEHGKFLCKKAKILQHNQQSAEAYESLKQAQKIFQKLETNPNSELAKLIKQTKLFLEQAASSQEKREDLLIEAEELLEKGQFEEMEARYESAKNLYQQALNIYQQLQDNSGLIQTLTSIADIHYHQGELKTALDILQNALNLTHKKKLLTLQAKVLSKIGSCYFLQGAAEQALEYFHDSLKINEQIGDNNEICALFHNIGGVYSHTGDHKKALHYYQNSLEISQKFENKHNEAASLGAIGNIHWNLGQYKEALSFYKKALELEKMLGNREGQAINIGNIASIYQHLGEPENLLKYSQKALQIHQEIGNKNGICTTLMNIANAHTMLKQYSEAIRYNQQILTLLREMGNKNLEGAVLSNLGSVYMDMKEHETALIFFQKAISLLQEAGAKQYEGITLGYLGNLFYLLENFEKAKSNLQQAISICRETAPPFAGSFYGDLALVEATQENFQQAFSLLKEGKPLLSSLPIFLGKFLCQKAKVLSLYGQPQKATQALEKAIFITQTEKIPSDSELVNKISETKEFITQQASLLKKTPQLSEDQTEDLLLEAEELIEKARLEEAESKYKKALEYLSQAMSIYQNLDHKKGIVHVLIETALIQRFQGTPQKSLQSFLQALELAQQEDPPLFQASIFTGLGNAYDDLGDSKKAINFYQKAINIHQSIGQPQSEADNLCSLGTTYKKLGRYKQALSSYEQALHLTRKIGNKRDEAVNLNNIAIIYSDTKEYNKALHFYQKAVEIFEEIGDKRSEGICSGNLGDLLYKLDRPKEAKPFFEISIAICDQTIPAAAAAFRASLAIILAEQGQFEQASQLLQEGESHIEIYPHEYVKFLCKKTKIYYLAQQIEEASLTLLQAQKISEQLNSSADSELEFLLKETRSFIS